MRGPRRVSSVISEEFVRYGIAWGGNNGGDEVKEVVPSDRQ